MINEKSFYSLKLISLGFILTFFLSCQKNDVYLVNTYEINHDWGYCILKNNKIIIKQTVIPTFSKTVRFKSQKDAFKVGQLVVERIKNNLSPTVTRNDLFLLKIKLE